MPTKATKRPRCTASLTFFAGSAIEGVLLRILRHQLVRWHLAAYTAERNERNPGIDARRLAWWQAAHTYRGWLQLAELAEGFEPERSSATVDAFPPDMRARLLGHCAGARRRTGM